MPVGRNAQGPRRRSQAGRRSAAAALRHRIFGAPGVGCALARSLADQRKRSSKPSISRCCKTTEALLISHGSPQDLPYREDPSDKTRATVRTEIRRDNGSRVPVNYTLHKLDSGWKAWDVTIEGIRTSNRFVPIFASEIDQKGLDAVITRLEANQAVALRQRAPSRRRRNSDAIKR